MLLLATKVTLKQSNQTQTTSYFLRLFSSPLVLTTPFQIQMHSEGERGNCPTTYCMTLAAAAAAAASFFVKLRARPRLRDLHAYLCAIKTKLIFTRVSG